MRFAGWGWGGGRAACPGGTFWGAGLTLSALSPRQVGVLQYGERAVHEWALGRYRTAEEVVEAAKNISRQEGRETRTAFAIHQAWWAPAAPTGTALGLASGLGLGLGRGLGLGSDLGSGLGLGLGLGSGLGLGLGLRSGLGLGLGLGSGLGLGLGLGSGLGLDLGSGLGLGLGLGLDL